MTTLRLPAPGTGTGRGMAANRPPGHVPALATGLPPAGTVTRC
jgi:hypothetical protein